MVQAQRAPALRFGEPRVQALLAVIVLFRLLPTGFSNRDLRPQLAGLLGLTPEQLTPGRMTYELRRLRLHGLIERIPRTKRYRVTDLGLRTAAFYTRAYARILRPGMALLSQRSTSVGPPLRCAFEQLEAEMDRWCLGKLAALNLTQPRGIVGPKI